MPVRPFGIGALPAGFFNDGRRRIWSAAAEHGLFVIAPLAVSVLVLHQAVAAHAFAVDFSHGPWIAGGRVLAGLTPYADQHSAVVRDGSAFVYPAVGAVFSVPFSLLPQVPASILFAVLCTGAVIMTLRWFGVRDWKVCGAVFLWPAVTSGLQTANLTLVLVFGVAAAWRYRDRALVTGALIALLVSIKLFVWPLAFWLLATRRYRAFAWCALSALALNLVAWAIVGFDQISRYLRLMHAVTRFVNHQGYGVMTLAGGNSSPVAYAIALALASILIGLAMKFGRRQERSAFALCTLACLVASPLVWLHYFSLLMVPLALARPRISAWWLLPVLLWFPITAPSLWQVTVVLIVAGSVTSLALQTPETRRRVSFRRAAGEGVASDGSSTSAPGSIALP
ncbi:MAG: glycosyltransferase family 87 protein [Solirubrobacteraceae bacterium]